MLLCQCVRFSSGASLGLSIEECVLLYDSNPACNNIIWNACYSATEVVTGLGQGILRLEHEKECAVLLYIWILHATTTSEVLMCERGVWHGVMMCLAPWFKHCTQPQHTKWVPQWARILWHGGMCACFFVIQILHETAFWLKWWVVGGEGADGNITNNNNRDIIID